jgi:hypothetical protein
MIGFARTIQASAALVLLTGLVAGCATTPPWAPRTPEVIPPQVCGGNADSDNDGVIDCNDRCPNTPRTGPNGTARGLVDPDGCPAPEPVYEPKPYRN